MGLMRLADRFDNEEEFPSTASLNEPIFDLIPSVLNPACDISSIPTLAEPHSGAKQQVVYTRRS